jgi:hypothetical protein
VIIERNGVLEGGDWTEKESGREDVCVTMILGVETIGYRSRWCELPHVRARTTADGDWGM